MKFKILNREEIDIDKWDFLILNSSSPRIYATSIYLDASTSKKWKAIVFDDYIAGIPVFEKKTMLFKYLAQPVLSQQLGLFIAKEHFSERSEYLPEVISFLRDRYKIGNMSLNEGNWISFPVGVDVVPRTNFLLDLSRSYTKISSNYSRSLIRNLKKSSVLSLSKNQYSVDSIMEFYHSNLNKKISLKSKNIWAMKRVLKALFSKGLAATYSSVDSHGKILSQSVYTFYGNRITHLLGSSNEKGIIANSMGFLIDQIIREYAESDFFFDFEGSDVPGVRDFFRRFAPEEKKYPQVFWDKTAGIYSFAKKIKTQIYQ